MNPRFSVLAIALAAAGLALAAPAEAQFIPGTSPMDMSAQSRALTSSVINRNALGATARRNPGLGRPRHLALRLQAGLMLSRTPDFPSRPVLRSASRS